MKSRGWAKTLPYEAAVETLGAENFLRVDGERVCVRRSGEGPALVFLHGMAASHFTFRDLIPLLDGSFETICIDLVGFGYSERSKDRENYRLEHQADRVVAILDQLGIEEAGICGHSLGSAVGLFLANRHPERVRALFLMSPVVQFAKPPWYFRNLPSLHLFYAGARLLLSRPEKFRKVMGRAVFREGVFTEEVSEEYRRQLLFEGLRDAFFGYAVALGRNPGLESEYRRLTHRTSILGGEEDAIVSADSLRKLEGWIKDSEFQLLSDCGHSAPEEWPEEVAERIRGFFR